MKHFFKPANQRVLVLPDDMDDKIGNIYVPDITKKDKPGRGIIISVGEGDEDHPMKYKVGDHILYSMYSGTEVDLDLIETEGRKTYLIMVQQDIWGILA